MEENKEVLLTQEGFDKLEQELENLKNSPKTTTSPQQINNSDEKAIQNDEMNSDGTALKHYDTGENKDVKQD